MCNIQTKEMKTKTKNQTKQRKSETKLKGELWGKGDYNYKKPKTQSVLKVCFVLYIIFFIINKYLIAFLDQESPTELTAFFKRCPGQKVATKPTDRTDATVLLN